MKRLLALLLTLAFALTSFAVARAATPAPATALANALTDAATALAADDLAAYQKLQPQLRSALDAYAASDASAKTALKKSGGDLLPDRTDLDSARADFAVASTATVDLLRAAGVDAQLKLKTFQCPMAPVVGKGRWFQREGGTKNPFYGSSMLHCGRELAAQKSASAGCCDN